MCQVTLLPALPLPSVGATAIGIAYNDEQDDPWSFRFALLHSNHFQESTWLPALPCLPLGVLKGWKNNFENLFSLILIRCKSFTFPLCAICISDMDIAQRVWENGGCERVMGRGEVRHSRGPNNYFFRFAQLVPF